MVEVELNEKDYKVILAWYELAFAGKTKLKAEDIAVMNKICVMCKSFIEEKIEDAKSYVSLFNDANEIRVICKGKQNV